MSESGSSGFVRSKTDGGAIFISVAFVAALLFGPIVIATGLLTSHHRDVTFTDITPDALRQSFDSNAPPEFRPSEP